MHQPVEPYEHIVKFARLSTGEDIVSEIIEYKDNTEEYYTLINPLKIVYVPDDKDGSLYVSLMEWVFPKICSEQKFKIYPSDVITLATVSESMEDYYYEALIRIENLKKEKKQPKKSDYFVEEETRQDITDEELELINKIMEGLNKPNRKLH